MNKKDIEAKLDELLDENTEENVEEQIRFLEEVSKKRKLLKGNYRKSKDVSVS